MFQELSAKVDKVAYNAMMNMTITSYASCKNTNAWNPVNIENYRKCTNEISDSNIYIKRNMDNIKSFILNRCKNMSIQIELEQILEEIELDPEAPQGLEQAIAYIKNVSVISKKYLADPDDKDFLEDIREVVIRLKMIELGIHGLGAGSAGLFLAYHHLKLGPYFGDGDGNEWPYIPLHKEPTKLEYNFNQLLTNITFVMSNGTLKNTSILDLPAFGSTIGTLKKGLKEQFVWPTKINFALLEINPATKKKNISMAYKTLKEDWADHMNQVYEMNHGNLFTSDMGNNVHLNFTSSIRADMKTFLTAIAGNKRPAVNT